MLVGQLIEALRKFPEDSLVMGYVGDEEPLPGVYFDITDVTRDNDCTSIVLEEA